MTPAHRVVAVAQAFKETLTARVVAAAYREAALAMGLEPRVFVGSDGGDDLLEALRLEVIRETRHRVTGPVKDTIQVRVGWLNQQEVVIESRLVCGLGLIPLEARDPCRTTTRGLGELISAVAEAGAERVYVGLGGSGTMDGGLGMARAWGWVPRDDGDGVLEEGGGPLASLRRLEGGRAPPVDLIGLVDVRSPLFGPNGAWVFAAQKGAGPAQVLQLDRGVRRLAAVLGARGAAWAQEDGAGAAGGLGFGILAFGGGSLVPGARWVLERLGFYEALAEAGCVFTGEGAFDATSTQGKLTGEVLQAAGAVGIPTGLLAPSAKSVPAGVVVECGGGRWDVSELRRRAGSLLRQLLRLPLA